jgi:antitoxin ParD1/3/4
MNISLSPELERFVQAKVRTGQFTSPGQVVEAALSRMMIEPEADRLEPEELPRLRESVAQMNRGEVREWSEISAELRSRYLAE